MSKLHLNLAQLRDDSRGIFLRRSLAPQVARNGFALSDGLQSVQNTSVTVQYAMLTVRAAFSIVVAYSPRPMCLVKSLSEIERNMCFKCIPKHHKRREQQSGGVGNALPCGTREICKSFAGRNECAPSMSGAEPCTASNMEASYEASQILPSHEHCGSLTRPMFPDGVKPRPPMRPAHMSERISP